LLNAQGILKFPKKHRHCLPKAEDRTADISICWPDKANAERKSTGLRKIRKRSADISVRRSNLHIAARHSTNAEQRSQKTRKLIDVRGTSQESCAEFVSQRCTKQMFGRTERCEYELVQFRSVVAEIARNHRNERRRRNFP
jgi:hypothetical protein